MEEEIITKEQAKSIANFIYTYLEEYINENYKEFLKFLKSLEKERKKENDNN